jgi:hypothetical protein
MPASPGDLPHSKVRRSGCGSGRDRVNRGVKEAERPCFYSIRGQIGATTRVESDVCTIFGGLFPAWRLCGRLRRSGQEYQRFHAGVALRQWVEQLHEDGAPIAMDMSLRSIFKVGALLALALVAGCQNTSAQYPTLATRCLDRPFEAGKCHQESDFRLFGPGGPIVGEE